jgi:hypothetical protein
MPRIAERKPSHPGGRFHRDRRPQSMRRANADHRGIALVEFIHHVDIEVGEIIDRRDPAGRSEWPKPG